MRPRVIDHHHQRDERDEQRARPHEHERHRRVPRPEDRDRELREAERQHQDPRGAERLVGAVVGRRVQQRGALRRGRGWLCVVGVAVVEGEVFEEAVLCVLPGRHDGGGVGGPGGSGGGRRR